MRIPAAMLVGAAVLLAIPVGWGLGVVLAYVLAGPDIGVLPALTIPVAMTAAIAVALSRSLPALWRFALMAGGTAGLVVLSLLTA